MPGSRACLHAGVPVGCYLDLVVSDRGTQGRPHCASGTSASCHGETRRRPPYSGMHSPQPTGFPAAAGEGRWTLQATQPAEPSAGLPVLEKYKEQIVQRKGSEPRVHVSASSVVRSGAGLSSHCTSVKRQYSFCPSAPPGWEEDQVIMVKCSVHVGCYCPRA